MLFLAAQAYRAQVPKEGRPKRLTNSASQKKSTQSVAVEQPGKDDRPAVDASPPVRLFPEALFLRPPKLPIQNKPASRKSSDDYFIAGNLLFYLLAAARLKD